MTHDAVASTWQWSYFAASARHYPSYHKPTNIAFAVAISHLSGLMWVTFLSLRVMA